MAYAEVDTKTLRDMRAWSTENLKTYLFLCRKNSHARIHNKGRRLYQNAAEAAEMELARRLGENWEQKEP